MSQKSWVVVGVFLFAFAFYLHGAAPTVTTGDSGEFMTAAHTLAIPHPPAFPSYTWTAHLVSTLIPWATVAYRINLFSSLCGALSLALLAAFLIEAGLSLLWVAVVCAVALFSPQIVTISSVTEVFAMHVALCLAVLWCAPQRPWLSCFLLGVGFANHQTILLLAPAVVCLSWQRWTSPMAVFRGVLIVALGASFYFVLPLRAMKQPMMNWDDARTLPHFIRLVTRADYGALTLSLGAAPARTLANTWLQLERFFHGIVAEVSWAGIALGVLGWVWGCRHDRKTWGWGLAFVMVGPFFFVLGNLPFDGQSQGLLGRFYTVPVFLWLLFMAYGLFALARFSSALPWAVGLLPLLVLLKDHPAEAFVWRHEIRAYTYGLNNLRSLSPNALLVMDGGDDTFYTLAYLTQVERRRPDVELHDRGGLVFPNPYGPDFRQLTRDQKQERRQQVERIWATSGRLFYSTMNPGLLPGVSLYARGILYATRPQPAEPWATYDLRGVRPWQSARPDPDYRTRALLPYYAYQRAAQAIEQSQWTEARGYLDTAQAVGPDVLWLQPNLAYQRSRLKQP